LTYKCDRLLSLALDRLIISNPPKTTFLALASPKIAQVWRTTWIDDRLHEKDDIIEKLENKLQEADKVNYQLAGEVKSLRETVNQLVLIVAS
jgi:hypothetical protein